MQFPVEIWKLKNKNKLKSEKQKLDEDSSSTDENPEESLMDGCPCCPNSDCPLAGVTPRWSKASQTGNSKKSNQIHVSNKSGKPVKSKEGKPDKSKPSKSNTKSQRRFKCELHNPSMAAIKKDVNKNCSACCSVLGEYIKVAYNIVFYGKCDGEATVSDLLKEMCQITGCLCNDCYVFLKQLIKCLAKQFR